MTHPKFPFQASQEQLRSNLDPYIDQFIDGLQSFFMMMPRGSNFISLEQFESAYNTLVKATEGFSELTHEQALRAVKTEPLVLIVLRCILGFTPGELAHASDADGKTASYIDQRARKGLDLFSRTRKSTREVVNALVATAVQLITTVPPNLGDTLIHRLDKVDTSTGIASVRGLHDAGVSYSTMLYERSFLGRAFASHRDSIPEQVGDITQGAVRQKLAAENIPFYESRGGERFEEMDQAADFLLPNRSKPSVFIEAKLAEDDGTVRDKVTRIQHLAELRDERVRRAGPRFEVVACVDGRGLGVRRDDARKLLEATGGKLFTLRTLPYLVEHTSIRFL